MTFLFHRKYFHHTEIFASNQDLSLLLYQENELNIFTRTECLNRSCSVFPTTNKAVVYWLQQGMIIISLFQANIHT